ncbi:MAG TPA: hypothetical protein VLQ67_00825 [Arachnia sp.]|nr:hypothetical protein [Arachnia sp.]
MVDDNGADDRADAPPEREARGSRRWVTGAVVGGLVLAAVAIPLGYQALWGPDGAVPGDSPSASPTVSGSEAPMDPTPSATVPSQSSEPPVSPGENPCPGSAEEAGQERFQLTPFDGDLPDGAVSAWLCGDPNEGFTSTGGPAEALTEGVDELVAAFNALEPLPQDMACTLEYRMTYVVVVDYADGSKRLSGELHGCRAVSDGERRLAGADGFLATIVGLWEDQRAGLQAPTEAPEVCPPLTTLVAATPEDVLAGYVCSRDFGDIRILQEVPDDLLARMTESLKTDVGGEVPGMGIDDRGAFVLVDGWGSTTSLVPLHDGNFAVDPGPLTEFTYWKPPVDLAEELHAFLGPEPSPTG